MDLATVSLTRLFSDTTWAVRKIRIYQRIWQHDEFNAVKLCSFKSRWLVLGIHIVNDKNPWNGHLYSTITIYLGAFLIGSCTAQAIHPIFSIPLFIQIIIYSNIRSQIAWKYLYDINTVWWSVCKRTQYYMYIYYIGIHIYIYIYIQRHIHKIIYI